LLRRWPIASWKIQVVVVTQTLSIPFLFLLGFSPWFGAERGGVFLPPGADEYEQPGYTNFCDGARR
jgi:hypothetical protein